jgi:DHA2 family multidrug resistance protein-like MFS transporter
MSVNTALIRLIYPQRFLGRGMGINSFVVAVSSAAGPTIAAAILSLASWQWLFLINVPLGIVALLLAMRFLPPNSARSKIIRFDLPSAIMNALTFGLLITALSGFAQGQSTQLVLAEVAAMLVVGFSSFAASSRCPSPCCRSTCCASRSSPSLSAPPSALSARRCWRWSLCPSSCSR